MMTALEEIWPGWEIIRVIGKGGFGKVYEIRKIDENIGGDYRSALKVISIPRSEDEYLSYKDDGYDDESITTIFKDQMNNVGKEFALMSQFKGTSHIVSYEEHIVVPNKKTHGWDILIRMELLTSLPDYYNQREGFSEAEIVKLGIDICSALELCAKREIVHRDVKPQNIFINEFGDYKLGDFGIARSLERTIVATRIGTYAYMPPEVYLGKPYNASVDLYSLGLVLYWLLNERRLPFLPLPPKVPSGSQNDEARKRRMMGEDFPMPVNGSKALFAVIRKACAYHPENRFTSAEDMRRALERLNPDFSRFYYFRESNDINESETIPLEEEESGKILSDQNIKKEKSGSESKRIHSLKLIKGQKINLSSESFTAEKLVIGIGWDLKTCDPGTDFDLDLAAFMLGENGKCSNKNEFIFYGNLMYPDGALMHMGDNLTGKGEGDAEQIIVDLMKIPSHISKIVFTVTIYDAERRKQSFKQVLHSFIRMLDEHTGQEILHYDFGEDLAIETAVVAGELYKYKGKWKFNAVGNGFQGGLETLCRYYGLDVVKNYACSEV